MKPLLAEIDSTSPQACAAPAALADAQHEVLSPARRSDGPPACPERARIAVWHSADAPPRVEDVDSCEIETYISRLATRTYEVSRSLGGTIAFAVINEVVENFIHADFRSPVVTILDCGNTIRFSDRGPGFTDRTRALEPGYTTASCEMRRHIKGVGSGLPLVRECLAHAGGSVTIEDNLGSGAVVTIHGHGGHPEAPLGDSAVAGIAGSTPLPRPSDRLADTGPSGGRPVIVQPTATVRGSAVQTTLYPEPAPVAPRLSHRQMRVLALVMDVGTAGPSQVSRELKIGLSTAYRDLSLLETLGLIKSDEGGKRCLTDEGVALIEDLLHPGRR